MSEIKGFLVLPVTLPATKFCEETVHYIYIKKHQSNNELSDRSLFLINPPLDSSLSKFKSLFQKISPNSIIENFFNNDENLDYDINLSNLTSDLYEESSLKLPNKTCLITFLDKSGLNLAYNNIKKCKSIEWPKNEKISSIKMFDLYNANRLNTDEYSTFINQEINAFESRESNSINELKHMKDIVDKDGFTLVVGKSRKTKKGIFGKIDSLTKKSEIKEQSKMKVKEKKDFYRFQVRENKKNEMNELLKKFREDQEKIKILKEKKRFRPY